jgi:hypothetical protein
VTSEPSVAAPADAAYDTSGTSEGVSPAIFRPAAGEEAHASQEAVSTVNPALGSDLLVLRETPERGLLSLAAAASSPCLVLVQEEPASEEAAVAAAVEEALAALPGGHALLRVWGRTLLHRDDPCDSSSLDVPTATAVAAAAPASPPPHGSGSGNNGLSGAGTGTGGGEVEPDVVFKERWRQKEVKQMGLSHRR